MGIGGIRMEDRFKFRAWNKLSDEMRDVISLNINYEFPDCSNVILETNTFDNIKTHNNPITCANGLNNVVLMQCTGLKDKNGKLIYEGDIVKYAEFDWTDFSFKDWETEIAQVVWGNTYDNYYPAFDLKDTDFDGTNSFAYLFNEGWTIEVIGNIYENPELLED